MRSIEIRAVAGSLAFAALLPLAAAHAQSYGLDWVTIGDAGNRDTLPHEVPWRPDLAIGGVDYEYRMTRTELTVEQHFEYVQAYWRYLPPEDRRGPAFTGIWIGSSGSWDNPQYYIRPGAEHRPTTMSWRHAARFCNWLHNDKVPEQWAFEQGAYDTSTFTYNSDGTFNDQAGHDPGAKFWIPTEDEQAKALFWDPAKKQGEGGYWRYPHSSEEPPIPGAPWDGGETNAGVYYWELPHLDVGSYPWAASPWGLLDGSGGVSEWNEFAPPERTARGRRGTMEYESDPQWVDRLDYYWLHGRPSDTHHGLRLASVVPAPATCAVLVSGITLAIRMRRVR